MAGSAGTVATPLPTTWGVLKVVYLPNSEAGIVQSLDGSIRSLRAEQWIMHLTLFRVWPSKNVGAIIGHANAAAYA